MAATLKIAGKPCAASLVPKPPQPGRESSYHTSIGLASTPGRSSVRQISPV